MLQSTLKIPSWLIGEAREKLDVRATYSATTSRVISYEDAGEVDSKDYTSLVSHTSRSAAERSASEYLTWTKGDKVTLSVNNLGTVSGEPRRVGAR